MRNRAARRRSAHCRCVIRVGSISPGLRFAWPWELKRIHSVPKWLRDGYKGMGIRFRCVRRGRANTGQRPTAYACMNRGVAAARTRPERVNPAAQSRPSDHGG